MNSAKKKKKAGSRWKNLFTLIIILAIVLGVPYVILNYQAGKSGMSIGEVVQRKMFRGDGSQLADSQAGIPEDRIETRLIQGAQSRAGALLDKARAAKCDTIVMGRKGVSDVENFDLGRIPRKIIYASRKFTIWLIP